MKKILLLALPLMVMCAVSCEKKWTDDSPIIQFKDPKFLEVVLNTYDNEGSIDRNGDGQISEKEALLIQELYIDGGVRNIDEIRYFTALTKLQCGGNPLTSLDVSNNAALTYLHCGGNQLTSLDLSKNTALTYLDCNDNQLTSLDLSKNTALTYLDCNDNQLTSLDLYNNRLIESLWCKNNPLQKLILYKYHIINDNSIERIESEYGDIIEYVE